MSLKDQFEAAVAESKSLPERPDNATLLKLYALYKQGSSGDAEGERPG
ncbi:MAG: acyl-CoA-binding protein, partial [Paucibacter sp.]|nr:acyl-CoA-binding protein [Roseateles sp.]